MSFKSFKNEFTEVYNYLSDVCKNPTVFFGSPAPVESTPEEFFWFFDDDPIIYNYIGSFSIVKIPIDIRELGSRDGTSDDYISFEDCVAREEEHSFSIYDIAGCFEGSGVSEVILRDDLEIIGFSAFCDCFSLTSINIPNSVEKIGSLAFAGCVNLTSLNIPDGVSILGSRVFHNCAKLVSVKLPKHLSCIRRSTFQGCVSLSSIELPVSLNILEAEAFRNCSSLKSIDIPDSVKTIGEGAFAGCKNLKFLTCSKGLDLSEADVPDGCEVIRR